jgi:hypothetical protein
MTLEYAQKSRESPHKVEIPLLKQTADNFVLEMNKRDDIVAAESMSSPFGNQLCDHKQVTKYILGCKRLKVKTSKYQIILLIPLQIAICQKFLYKRILQSVIPLQYQNQLSKEKMYDWVMQNTHPSDLTKCLLALYSSSIYSWLSNDPLCIKISRFSFEILLMAQRGLRAHLSLPRSLISR